MSLVKTEKGRGALINRDVGLTHRERQILVMSDGKRTRQEMRKLFVADVTDDFKRLFSLGMLIDISETAITPANMSATGTFRTSALSDFQVQTQYKDTLGFSSTLPTALPAPSAPSAPLIAIPQASAIGLKASTAPKARRSMAAAKMYMIDILQRMRDMDSPAIAVAIQTSQDEADLAANLINASRYIFKKSGGSFGHRVFDKLYETIPEIYLDEMNVLAFELENALSES